MVVLRAMQDPPPPLSAVCDMCGSGVAQSGLMTSWLDTGFVGDSVHSLTHPFVFEASHHLYRSLRDHRDGWGFIDVTILQVMLWSPDGRCGPTSRLQSSCYYIE